MRVGLREQHQGEGTHRGDGHKEVLVEHLAIHDVAPRLEQHVVAGDEVRHQEHDEFQVHRIGFAAHVAGKRNEFGYREHQREQHQRHNDTVACTFLFLIHGRPPSGANMRIGSWQIRTPHSQSRLGSTETAAGRIAQRQRASAGWSCRARSSCRSSPPRP